MDDSTEKFEDGKYLTRKAKYILLWVVIILFFGYILGVFSWVEEPGSFFEKNEYTGMFYVYAYLKEDSVKNYRLPAKISRVRVCDGEDCGHGYNVDYMTFPNGHEVAFSVCELGLKSKSLCYPAAKSDSEYYVQISSERVK